MKARHKRLTFIVAGLAGLVVAVVLIANAFRSNLVFFFSPTDVHANQAPVNSDFRLGGMVQEGSLKREDDGLTVHFVVTDTNKTVDVTFTGILPDLFREGQGVVAQGRLGEGGTFMAKEVLAKHDESYVPPEVKDAMEKGKMEKAKRETSASIQQN